MHAVIVNVVSRFDAEVKIVGTCGHSLSSLTAKEVKSILIIVSVVTVHLIPSTAKLNYSKCGPVLTAEVQISIDNIWEVVGGQNLHQQHTDTHTHNTHTDTHTHTEISQQYVTN